MPRVSDSMRRTLWTVAALATGILLHVDRIPVWIVAVVTGCIGWRVAMEFRLLPVPGRYIRVAATLLLMLAVMARFHTFNGLAAGTALLAVMGGVKLLETTRRRDRFIVIGASLFLLLAACLDRQSLLRAPLYLIHAWVCCTAFAMAAHESGSLTDRAAFALTGRSLLLAAPFAVVLFVLFPRLPGAFWALPPSGDAVTGLSDTMSPGSITQLTSSFDPAFNARFEGQPPPPEERYWRGPVLHDFDGFTWRRGRGLYRELPLEPLGPVYRYTITMEPHDTRWWFALDTPAGSPARRVWYTHDYQLIAREPVTRLTSFEGTSYTRARTMGELSVLARRIETRLPENRNPRTAQLARELREKIDSDAAFVDAVLELFRTGGFEYSLEPQPLGLDSVDDFLFGTRAGFCGHYASAFATLMRAAGVPARVVTGYLGGEWNPIGGFFIIRQSDAHAWTEVWLNGRGWVRVDPTAVVEPARLRTGILDLLPGAVSAPARLRHAMPWLGRLMQHWDALNNWWNESVVKFDFETQSGLLRFMGIRVPEMKHLGWGIAATLVLWLLWISWQIGISTRSAPPDRLARLYSRLCAKLAREGIERPAHFGPLAYADLVSQRRPDLDAQVRPLLRRYAELRYGAASEVSRAALMELTRAIRRLRLSRA